MLRSLIAVCFLLLFSPAQAVIIHENRMSSSYRLVKAVYALDGARIFSKADEEGSLGERRERNGHQPLPPWGPRWRSGSLARKRTRLRSSFRLE